MRRTTFSGAALIACVLVAIGWTSPEMRAAPPVESADATSWQAKLAAVLTELNSRDYYTRQAAIQTLQELADGDAPAAELSLSLRQRLRQPDLSYEQRAEIDRVLATLPAAEGDGPGPIDDARLQAVISDLDADQYAVRLNAQERLDWYLRSPTAAWSMYRRLQGFLDRRDLPLETRRRLEPLAQRARGAWLVNDPADEQLPPESDANITHWVEALLAPSDEDPPRPATSAAYGRAERELLDLLARRDTVDRCTEALNAARARDKAGELTGAASDRLLAVWDWTRPGMIAEFWTSGEHRNIQYLLVDVPNIPAGALKPSHFDRIDDHVAHCVSGNSLSPGDYPVGVLFPHPDPNLPNAQFHLVNLPTPRRRMAYEYQVQVDEKIRLAALSERTVDYLFSRDEAMNEREIGMLASLDPRPVSRAVEDYLMKHDDEPRGPGRNVNILGSSNVHGVLCVVLAATGTHEAALGLQRAIKADRFLPPTEEEPYDMPWIAMFSIAGHDPWPGVEPWLAEFLENEHPVIPDPNLPREAWPDAGATAAAILLARHDVDPSLFGLEPEADDFLKELGVTVYRFTGEGNRAAVIDWWRRHKDEAPKQNVSARGPSGYFESSLTR